MSGLDKPPRQGPCQADDCKDRNKSSGQWTYLPKKIALKYGKPEWSCVCKKAGCLRWAEVPGAPTLKRAKLNEPAVAVALKEAEDLPRPYALLKIDEIWAVRYASPARPPASPPPAARRPPHSPVASRPCLVPAGTVTSRR